jgi:hypothetical protein
LVKRFRLHHMQLWSFSLEIDNIVVTHRNPFFLICL